MNGLAAYVKANFELDPYSGALFVFRSKGGDRIKVLQWDDAGLALVHKRFAAKGIPWPPKVGARLALTRLQFEALFEGLDWRRIVPAREVTPKLL
ncbi:transposase [Rubellimicrobium aerolatum]|nr:transposase [Rubellimicrobium aerolatum]